MSFTPTLRTIAAGCTALAALLFALAASPDGAPSLADGPHRATVQTGGTAHPHHGPIDQNDVTWGA
ncbi:hypothetical protein ACIPW5_22550 [Streptomyces sp. NPDC090077]|uniref:hypothetical protein n=1 Tax=Streptomyces sp. NPDC090077 TaxID=3365938 RepID=UPI00381F8DC8